MTRSDGVAGFLMLDSGYLIFSTGSMRLAVLKRLPNWVQDMSWSKRKLSNFTLMKKNKL
jgi:hypothetical protein